MIIRCLIDGRPYDFDTEDESRTIGEGGEAVVMKWQPEPHFAQRYGVNGACAVKLYFVETKEQKAAAVMRQQKFRSFPRGLPSNAITPLTFVYDSSGQIIGYVMPLIEDVAPLTTLMKANERQAKGITQMHIVKILLNLHELLMGVHRAGVVLGDFNDKNVLVNPQGEVFLVDVDSAQWGQWPSLVATPEFSDPTLLDASQNLKPGACYSMVSDWYSFAVMVYQLLTLSHPYRDGVHKPRQRQGAPRTPRQRFPERVTTRLSVFDPSVHLDKSAHHPATLPEKLGSFMRSVFTEDYRADPFPASLLTTFQWMKCPRCGHEHGRSICPTHTCRTLGITRPQARSTTQVPPAKPRPTATHSSQTPPVGATFLTAASPAGTLKYVFHKDGAYRREGGSEVLAGPYSSRLSAFIAGERTVISDGPRFVIFNGGAQPRKHTSQCVYGKIALAANSQHVYWVRKDQLVRDNGQDAPVVIGTVAPHMTSVWAGERFGVAMVQAGVLTRILTFNTTRLGFVGQINLPVSFDKVIDATCVISNDLAWLTVTSEARSDGRLQNRCYVFNAKAQLRATAETRRGDGTWLGSMSSAAFAVGNKLLVPVARTGIVQIELKGGAPNAEGIHQGTEAIVSNASATTVGLALTRSGIVHVSRRQISQIPIR